MRTNLAKAWPHTGGRIREEKQRNAGVRYFSSPRIFSRWALVARLPVDPTLVSYRPSLPAQLSNHSPLIWSTWTSSRRTMRRDHPLLFGLAALVARSFQLGGHSLALGATSDLAVYPKCSVPEYGQCGGIGYTGKKCCEFFRMSPLSSASASKASSQTRD